MFGKLGLVAAAVLSIGAIEVASAADMAVKARPVPVPVFSWTGCYIGLSAGAGTAHTTDRATIPGATAGGITAPTSSLDLGESDNTTWLAGGQVGCNYQAGNWVFGVEADAHAQHWGQSTVLTPGAAPLFVANDRFDVFSDWQASARGRVGYALDRALFYVTGGAAFTELRTTSNFIQIGIFPGTLASQSRTLTGGTIGAGVEYAVTNNFTLGLEGRYTQYESQRFDAGSVAIIAVPGATVTFARTNAFRDVRPETGEMLVRANYKFGLF